MTGPYYFTQFMKPNAIVYLAFQINNFNALALKDAYSSFEDAQNYKFEQIGKSEIVLLFRTV